MTKFTTLVEKDNKDVLDKLIEISNELTPKPIFKKSDYGKSSTLVEVHFESNDLHNKFISELHKNGITSDFNHLK